jgi:hypothetical protein
MALFKRGRHLVISDFFVWMTFIWMIGAAAYVSGISAFWSAPGGEALEFFAGYFIARGFFFGLAALNKFVRVLRFFALFAILLAIADFITGRLIVHDALAQILGVKPRATVIFRENMVRATSTFEHPILFGSFCSALAAILLYGHQNTLRRVLWAGLCFVGCVMSLTSAALLSFFIVIGLYTYDRLMRRYPRRWNAVWASLIIFVSVIFVVANAPLGWLITHLTFDPESGYFRYLIWDAALQYIDQAPIAGYAFNLLHHEILDQTVDSVWLVTSLHYGVPAALFLFLANVTSFLPPKASRVRAMELDQSRMSTAFTVVLIVFILVGLTVHFWNFMWIFWAVCIGIRASLRELALGEAPEAVSDFHVPALARL